tara:strand:- start:317 stop:577 length:261 start_codon:yes stop_codon:yes gene_type:complete
MANTPTRSSFPTVIAFVGAFLVFAILLKFQFSGNEAEEVAVERPSLAEYKAGAAEKLNEVSVNAATGKVRLDIERAKELVIAENAK